MYHSRTVFSVLKISILNSIMSVNGVEGLDVIVKRRVGLLELFEHMLQAVPMALCVCASTGFPTIKDFALVEHLRQCISKY